MNSVVTVEGIQKRIFLLRGQKVMLDSDLAGLYGVEIKAFNRAVKRNRERCPADFRFQLRKEEYENLKSRLGTSSLRYQSGTSSWGGRRYMPYAFTERGVTLMSPPPSPGRRIGFEVKSGEPGRPKGRHR